MKKQTHKAVTLACEILEQFGYYIDNLWHVDDVHFICEQQELPRISNEEAMEVFVIAREQFDGEVGLSWPQLDQALKVFLQRKTILSTVYEASPA